MEMPRYRFPVSLIPGGCPQFLDFEVDFDAEDKNLKFSRDFYELVQGNTGTCRLYCIEEDEDGNWKDLASGAKVNPADPYSVSSLKALESFYEQWIPLPVPRMRGVKHADGCAKFEPGPSNWARAYIVRPKKCPQTGMQRLRIVLAFDTTVEDAPKAAPDQAESAPYFALSPADVTANANYSLAWHVRDNTWFLNEAWVDAWLAAIHKAWQDGQRRKFADSRDTEYLANYVTMLDLLHRLVPDVEVRVINPDKDDPVDVDLILDIGNARTTGILVETPPQRAPNLNNSYLLQIRDLSRPEHIYMEPFATRIEFSEADFGDPRYSKGSGRLTTPFLWASAVRMGPEAARLGTFAKNAEGTTGMSSPKRYLWDERPWKPTWRYNTGPGNEPEPPVTQGAFAQQVNDYGTPVACFDESPVLRPLIRKNPLYARQEGFPAFESMFTRSSMMMFLMGEILMQTLVTINAPASRGRRELSDRPRSLRRVIFTVPSGMPIAEQNIYRRWIAFAVHTVWTAMGWSECYVAPGSRQRPLSREYRQSPESTCNWDEASCTQLVYIYNEIIHKFHGDAHSFFRITGKKRPGYGEAESLRIASLDMGGGTTDLSIATFSLDNDEKSTARVRPHLNMRDGFNIAGDDILSAVIGEVLLRSIGRAVEELGVSQSGARHFLEECFGRDVLDTAQETKNLRAQFTRQVAAPVGLALLAAYEKTDPLRDASVSFRLRDFFDMPAPETETAEAPADSAPPFSPASAPAPGVLAYVENAVKKLVSGSVFSLLDVPVQMNPAEMYAVIYNTVKNILSALCEPVYLYGCDVLLLTGRPSRLNAVINAVADTLPLPADRILPMCEYHVGRWYPFVDPSGRISDPKTTVSTGAILCALAEGHLEGFSFVSGDLHLESTARFIGELDTQGRLYADKVWFAPPETIAKGQEKELEIKFAGPLFVGFRQFAAERWPTTRFYLLDFSTEENRSVAGGHLPYTVTVDFSTPDADTDGRQEEESEGSLRVVSVVDNDGNEVRGGAKAVEFRLQTMPREDGYWLDTGVLLSA